MFGNNKINRINEDIQREISALLRSIKDPRVNRQGMISVTAVDTTTDLRQAKVYISVYEPQSEKELLKGLKSASGFLRREIGKALSLRYTPELQFEIDSSIERGSRINSILTDLAVQHSDEGDDSLDAEPPSVLLDLSHTAQWLETRDSFLILTHRRPDGDTLGCAGALAQGLREYGKTAYVLSNPETTPRYMSFVEEYHAPDAFVAENTIAVDTATYDLLPKSSRELEGRVSLCIDHHSTNSKYAEHLCLDCERASCGEVIYDILMELSGGISPRTAECLYAAVATDTGCFVYANTTANSLLVASYLVEAGAPQKDLNKVLFRTKSRSRIKIEGMIYSGLEFHFDGKVAVSVITRKMMEEADATEDDVDDISSLPCAIEGVRVGVTIRELTSEEDCKVSVRTLPGVDSSAVAALFGGGGHTLAAGFSIKSTATAVKESLIEVLPDFFE